MDRPGWLNFLENKLLWFYGLTVGTTEILDPDELYRAVHPTQVQPDGSISTAVFRTTDEMSVDLARRTTTEKAWRRMRKRGSAAMVSITASLARVRNQRVMNQPVPLNHAHTLVIGKKTSSVAKHLARGANWVIKPTSGIV